jgi:basic membrane lipoprotein Med (substrate-binding protein (PBP1-ABC) superfamily)
MKTRREFLATAVAGAASLTASSGQMRKTLAGFLVTDETGPKDTAFNDSASGGRDMADKAEDPRITRARLSGPGQVTKNATVAEIAADGTMTVLVKGTNE